MSPTRTKLNAGSASPKTIDVLIVDDHPIVRKGLAQLISHEPDMNVCGDAEDVEQALTQVAKLHPDIVIVDLTLKKLSGLDLIRQLQNIQPDLATLVLSMHDESLYAERALRAGARGYIMKQEGTDKLVTAIRTVLAGDIYVSERMAARMLGKLVGGRSSEAPGSVMDRLSDRELEVFELLGRGLSTRQVAERLNVSVKTIESHREHIKQKLQLRNANELIQHATQWVTAIGAD
ncbi:response regulator transcription factor [Planctomycetales bacterium ZRK34]|nr:response regulator transcription factor [Planctomycetales bacterium ZRK34]